jgi:hypothetical protein
VLKSSTSSSIWLVLFSEAGAGAGVAGGFAEGLRGTAAAAAAAALGVEVLKAELALVLLVIDEAAEAVKE